MRGTAVALHLGHRDSIDFDFFGTEAFDPEALYRSIAFLEGSKITHVEPDTLTCVVDRAGSVKVSFFGYPELGLLEEPHFDPDTGLKIASLLDLSSTKVAVVQKRAEPKDHIDLDAIFTAGEIDLSLALAAAEALYGDAFHAESTLEALSYYDDGELSTIDPNVRDRLLSAVTAVDLNLLPEIDSLERSGEMEIEL